MVQAGKLPVETLAGPELEPEDSDIYDGYLELDRSDSGSLRTTSMFAVLEKGLGICDRQQQAVVRQLWRLMRAEESKVHEERREAEKARKKRGDRTNRRHRSRWDEEEDE